MMALTLIPLLVLAGLEAALRLAGYGYATGFFQRQQIGEKQFLVENPTFSLRFFPPALARWPTPIRMAAVKPPRTFRIFILGESAAQGDPEPAFGAGRYLEVLLNERYPEEHFEVVNVSITAINSNVILPIARECAAQHGDLWIIYMGNNEVVGPFGAATVFGAKAPPLWAIRLSLAIEQTRVGQLLQALTRKLKGRGAEPSWGGMQMFLGNQIRSDDPSREVVYRHFERNLQDIVRTGLDSGAKILLNTVAVNLRDSAPFASLTDPRLSAERQVKLEQCLTNGEREALQQDFAGATNQFADAARIDPRMAEAPFQWGAALLQLGQPGPAAGKFQLACDSDALPFRADSRINDIIRRTARDWGDPNLALADSSSTLAAHTASGILGSETFFEHVHFNFDGNYQLALAWADQVQRMLPAGFAPAEGTNWASQAFCEQRLGLTDWSRLLVVKSVLERLQAPPLSHRSNALQQREELLENLRRLNALTTADNAANARSIYLEAIRRDPDNHFLYENYAEFLQAVGDFSGSVEQWKRVQELQPQDPVACFQCGHVLELEGHWAESESNLLEAVSLRPSFVEAWYELGRVQFAQQRYTMALQNFETARRLRPNDPRVYYELGRTLSLLKQPNEALTNFEHAVALNPGDVEARYSLGGQFGLVNQVDKAREQFEEVIRLKPDFAPAHLNLGVALMMQGRPADAAREFETTLRLQPEDRTALAYLQKARAAAGSQ
jgi:tetratricopeptide (TPR) repeat protein